ncbi:hypothetical protein I6L80_21520 (plasmid) [Providencia rettgeri]|uniref:hypothetical protein n=1 Tax=Providencia TaxID=586 RepID=UPI00112446E7|nr:MULTISPECIES: hypothetical protein [Providencia]QXB07875.1 hypothetical protein I6L80_21520 [Providencia rettgeri]
MFTYPVKLEKDADTGAYIASCRDLPLMNSVGDDLQDALFESISGLVTAISIEMDERRPVPTGSKPEKGEHLVTVPVLVAMKASLHNAMIETGTRKAELARKMGKNPQQIDRLLDAMHSSKVEAVEQALYLLNKTVSVDVANA